jgi:ferredoxin
MPAVVDNEKCTGCESCVDECPSEAIAMAEEKAQIDIDACVDCAAGVDACPVEAISME